MNVPLVLVGAGSGLVMGGPVGAVAGGLAAALVSGGGPPAPAADPVVGVSPDRQVMVARDGSMMPTPKPITSPYPRPLEVAPLTDVLSTDVIPRGILDQPMCFRYPCPTRPVLLTGDKLVLGVGPGQPSGVMQLAGFDGLVPSTPLGWAVVAGGAFVAWKYRKQIKRLFKKRRR